MTLTRTRRPAAGVTHPAPLRTRVAASVHSRLLAARACGADRGDVPGWVLVTVMSAAVVLALWAAAETLLPQVFEEAVTSVRRG
ncbi:hypothetical protein ACTVCO_07040 [Sanguibacter sp. A247]|uniref:hypothetical protein n=1 Tax=unclassified Sanguibacter TaxID=2645534 RepID=UPI003FD86FA6